MTVYKPPVSRFGLREKGVIESKGGKRFGIWVVYKRNN